MVHESIAEPNNKIAKGYPANVMPQNFAQTISPKELEQLVEYLIESTSRQGRRLEVQGRLSPAAGGRCEHLLTMRQRLRERLEISPQRYAQVSAVALGALALIVLTGAAVRLTGSGLGCPDWPKCYGQTAPPLESHAVIEYGNRLLTGFVGFAVIAASVLAFFRRPYRWHLALFGALLPLGVIGQAILGALVVKYHLAPGLVMLHFILSMMLLDAAFALAWCSRYEPWERRRSSDRLGVWAVRALIPLGQLTILAGTVATASGPHAGAHAGQLVHRFTFEGAETLEWVVQRHAAIATVFGLTAIGVWFLLQAPWRRQEGGEATDGGPGPAGAAGSRRRLPVVPEAADGDRLGPRRARDRRPGWRCSGRSRRRGAWSRGGDPPPPTARPARARPRLPPALCRRRPRP